MLGRSNLALELLGQLEVLALFVPIEWDSAVVEGFGVQCVGDITRDDPPHDVGSQVGELDPLSDETLGHALSSRDFCHRLCPATQQVLVPDQGLLKRPL